MNTTIGLDSISAIAGFEMIKKIALKSDENAVINPDNYSVTFKDKKKILVVKSENQEFYVLPNMFIEESTAEKFNLEKVNASFGSPTP